MWQKQAAVEAAQRIASGDSPEALVHLVWFPEQYEGQSDDELFAGLSSSISWTQFQRGGYTERYWELGAVATW